MERKKRTQWNPIMEKNHQNMEVQLRKDQWTSLEELEDIIIDKLKQIIWKTKISGLMEVQLTEYRKSKITPSGCSRGQRKNTFLKH